MALGPAPPPRDLVFYSPPEPCLQRGARCNQDKRDIRIIDFISLKLFN